MNPNINNNLKNLKNLQFLNQNYQERKKTEETKELDKNSKETVNLGQILEDIKKGNDINASLKQVKELGLNVEVSKSVSGAKIAAKTSDKTITIKTNADIKTDKISVDKTVKTEEIKDSKSILDKTTIQTNNTTGQIELGKPITGQLQSDIVVDSQKLEGLMDYFTSGKMLYSDMKKELENIGAKNVEVAHLNGYCSITFTTKEKLEGKELGIKNYEIIAKEEKTDKFDMKYEDIDSVLKDDTKTVVNGVAQDNTASVSGAGGAGGPKKVAANNISDNVLVNQNSVAKMSLYTPIETQTYTAKEISKYNVSDSLIAKYFYESASVDGKATQYSLKTGMSLEEFETNAKVFNLIKNQYMTGKISFDSLLEQVEKMGAENINKLDFSSTNGVMADNASSVSGTGTSIGSALGIASDLQKQAMFTIANQTYTVADISNINKHSILNIQDMVNLYNAAPELILQYCDIISTCGGAASQVRIKSGCSVSDIQKAVAASKNNILNDLESLTTESIRETLKSELAFDKDLTIEGEGTTNKISLQFSEPWGPMYAPQDIYDYCMKNHPAEPGVTADDGCRYYYFKDTDGKEYVFNYSYVRFSGDIPYNVNLSEYYYDCTEDIQRTILPEIKRISNEISEYYLNLESEFVDNYGSEVIENFDTIMKLAASKFAVETNNCRDYVEIKALDDISALDIYTGKKQANANYEFTIKEGFGAKFKECFVETLNSFIEECIKKPEFKIMSDTTDPNSLWPEEDQAARIYFNNMAVDMHDRVMKYGDYPITFMGEQFNASELALNLIQVSSNLEQVHELRELMTEIGETLFTFGVGESKSSTAAKTPNRVKSTSTESNGRDEEQEDPALDSDTLPAQCYLDYSGPFASHYEIKDTWEKYGNAETGYEWIHNQELVLVSDDPTYVAVDELQGIEATAQHSFDLHDIGNLGMLDIPAPEIYIHYPDDFNITNSGMNLEASPTWDNYQYMHDPNYTVTESEVYERGVRIDADRLCTYTSNALSTKDIVDASTQTAFAVADKSTKTSKFMNFVKSVKDSKPVNALTNFGKNAAVKACSGVLSIAGALLSYDSGMDCEDKAEFTGDGRYHIPEVMYYIAAGAGIVVGTVYIAAFFEGVSAATILAPEIMIPLIVGAAILGFAAWGYTEYLDSKHHL